MSIIKPFAAWRPTPANAAKVASLPYDVMNSEEARRMADGNPLSYLHVARAEIDMDPSIDVHSDAVYEKGKSNFLGFCRDKTLVRDSKPCFYLYEQRMRIGQREHVQVGLVAGASVHEYQTDLIKKHELTRADKELDRTRHVDTVNANTEPVFLTYAANPEIDGLVAEVTTQAPAYDFVADDGIGHRFWVVADDTSIRRLEGAFAKLAHLYVADGHHRSAAASSVQKLRAQANPAHTGQEPYNFFLAVIFPHNQMYIMDYNRVVLDLCGMTEAQFQSRVAEKFDIAPAASASVTRATEFGMYLGGKWHRLTAKPGSFDPRDPIGSLDVSILQNNLLAPILDIGDPRRDKRIDFVGGIRGTAELERRVREGAAVAFAMFPTSIEQLMTIADAGEIMPPKSTWFEPKLRSGLFVRTLD